MVNETIASMRDVATSYCFNFAQDVDAGLPELTKKEIEEGVSPTPTKLWVMTLRESVVSWSLFDDEDSVIDLLTRVLETNDKQERERRVQFLLNGTTALLSAFTRTQVEEVISHLAWSLSWANRSSYLDEGLAESCGTEEHFQTMFTDASWTLFLYLYVTDHRTPE